MKLNLVYSQEGGYAQPWSVAQNETITFYISTSINPFTAKLYKLGKQVTLLESFSSLKGGKQGMRDSAYWYGAGWNPTFTYTIPDSFTPGVYRLNFPVTNNKSLYLLFIVRMVNPGSYSKILVMLNSATWQAYNPWGGKSLFYGNSTDSIRSYKVSLQRPIINNQYYNYENQLINWLGNKKIPIEVCTNQDVYKYPELLAHYSILIKAGIDLFWSMEERKQMEQFINQGKKLIIMGGGTCWWQVRYENDINTLVCYKTKFLDPLNGKKDSLVTVKWFESPLNYPENSLTGTSFRNGGYVAYDTILPKSEGYGDYAVFSSNHWIYKQTKLNDGDEFGWENDIVGYMTDGTLYQWKNGMPEVTGEDMTPLNFKILGISPAESLNKKTHATMGFYSTKNGGAVFNASTSDWVHGINNDPIVSTITMNVIKKFQTGNFPPDILSWAPSWTTCKMINGEYLPINKREILISKKESVRFSIRATDLEYHDVTYFWKKNDKIISNDSFFIYHRKKENEKFKKFKITGYSCNQKDTSSISWDVYEVNHIRKLPKGYVDHFYRYLHPGEGSGTVCPKKNHRYTLLIAPYWIKIDSLNGTISGTPKEQDLGTYSVLIQFTLKNKKFVYFAYQIEVIPFTPHQNISQEEVFISKERISQKSDTGFNRFVNTFNEVNNPITIFPNPAKDEFSIAFNTSVKSGITLQMTDIYGRKMYYQKIYEEKQIYKIKIVPSVPNGIYLINVTVGKIDLSQKIVFNK